MKFNVENHLAGVERTVSFLERDGQPTGAVSISRGFSASVEDLWDAITNADRIPRWFLPLTGDLKLGGRYQLEGNAGGVVTECERLTHLALTWEFGEDISWVDVRLSAQAPVRARLTLTHTAHLLEHWDTFGPGAVGVGWEMGLMGLALHLAQPDEPKPDDTEFATSPDGKVFITGSSESWGQAAVASGTDPDSAAAATSRTTAFYTGEPAEPACTNWAPSYIRDAQEGH